MGLKATATVLRMMAVVVCAAGTCFSNTGSCSGPGGPDCCSTVPGDIDGAPPVDLRDFARLADNWRIGATRLANSSDPNLVLYSDLLRKVVAVVPMTADGRVSLPIYSSSSGYPPWGDVIADRRLTEPQAVPYLIDVMRNGPGWQDEDLPPRWGETFRYIARCHAALYLGKSGDPRAFGPLLETLQDTRIPVLNGTPYRSDDQHDLRNYVAYALGELGDDRAIEPLVTSLRNDHYAYSIDSLLRLNAFSIVPTMIDVAHEYQMVLSIFSGLHYRFTQAMRMRFELAPATNGGRWLVEDYPQVGVNSVFPDLEGLWLHWRTHGDRYAREWFDKYYPEWDSAVRTAPNETSLRRVLAERMLAGGVSVLPYLVARIRQGDDRLIPFLGQLIRDPQTALCSSAECLEWWRHGRRHWQVFDVTAAGRVLRVPGRYPTIQAAIDDANEGDLVVVGPGTYREVVRMKAGVDLVGSGAAETILTAERTNAVVRGANNCRLDGFTITGYAHEDIDGVHCEDVNDFTIANCVIKDNTWSGVNVVRSSVVIRNNVICGNRCAGVFASYPAGDRCVIVNNTIWNNANEADVTIWHGADALVVNNIMEDTDCDEQSAAEIRYNDIVAQAVDGDNLRADPLFADPNAGDYHLKSQAGRWNSNRKEWVLDDVTSPCIDAGDPVSPLGHEPFPNGGRINLGAFGGTIEASKPYFGEPACQTMIPGDINGDCRVDFRDLEILSMHWLHGDR